MRGHDIKMKEIQCIKQPTEFLCGQACVAMIANVSVNEVIQVMNNDNATGKWHITHKGKCNFAVWLYTTKGRDLIVNEIGIYDGNRVFSIPSGSNAILVIEADGDWTIAPAD